MGRSFTLILAFVAGLTCSPIIFPEGIGSTIRNLINSIRNDLPVRNSEFILQPPHRS